MELSGEILGQVDPESGVNSGMPLLDPRQNLGDTRDHRYQFGERGALGLAIGIDRGEGDALLGVVPTGPAEQRRGIGGAASARVRDEPFLGYVEFAAVRPVRGFQEVGG